VSKHVRILMNYLNKMCYGHLINTSTILVGKTSLAEPVLLLILPPFLSPAPFVFLPGVAPSLLATPSPPPTVITNLVDEVAESADFESRLTSSWLKELNRSPDMVEMYEGGVVPANAGAWQGDFISILKFKVVHNPSLS
jgi:hypothetical protein